MNPSGRPPAPAEKPPIRPVDPASPNVSIHVGELVLDGFPSGDRDRIGEAFERELTRLVSERGALRDLDRGANRDRLSGGSFQFEPDARPESTGAAIARAVFGGLKR